MRERHRKPRLMPRDDDPAVPVGRGRLLLNDEPAEIVRHIMDEAARWAVEHDPRRSGWVARQIQKGRLSS
ncbi:hypothetical protein NS365_21920 [Aureimonas ureilytica]|uniref:Uncharacterized protein n=1 Tax=Aureimonas ureilytica TaxID=401562 RepID=A0A175RG76_9HYPH|nr:hypothetical protein [Aureimonas ureilytica]KTR02273.1 hypothetical protein NS365_21920 [Aureimonas ureilytica]